VAVTQPRAREPARGPRARTPTPCDRFPVGSHRVVRRPLATRKRPSLPRPQSVPPVSGPGRSPGPRDVMAMDGKRLRSPFPSST